MQIYNRLTHYCHCELASESERLSDGETSSA